MLAALGSVAVGGATAVSTGAFTSVSANRSVSVNVADDSDALLAIRKDTRDGDVTANAEEYVNVNGQVSLDFTETTAGAGGINDEATTIIDDLLSIENQGTQGVYVGYTHPASPTGNFALFHEDQDFRGPGGGSNYDASAGNYNNDGQLNINTAPDNDGDGNPDLVFLEPGESLEHIGLFFFGSPNADAISEDPSPSKLLPASLTFEAITSPKSVQAAPAASAVRLRRWDSPERG
jgi:hypothetical protein